MPLPYIRRFEKMWIEFRKVMEYSHDLIDPRIFAERKPKEMGFKYYCWKGASSSEKMEVSCRDTL